MRALTSIVHKLDSPGLLGTLQLFHRATKLRVRCVAFVPRSKDTGPRTMSDNYTKNSSWLGVYERNPLKKDPLTQEFIDDTVKKEKEKNILPDLKKIINYKKAVWTKESRRVGAIGRKIGRTTIYTKDGKARRVSLIQIKDCTVLCTQISREEQGTDRRTQMILGSQDITNTGALAKVSYRKMQWYDKRNSNPKTFWMASAVSKECLLFPGTRITASHFVAGQYVRVTGKTIQREFQGVMKRWGMKGNNATHGCTKSHRKMGATGGGQDPGRIFPGRKMAGHVGHKWKNTGPMKLWRVDYDLGVLFVEGTVPGHLNCFLMINDCGDRPHLAKPPFPTHFEDKPDKQDKRPRDMYARGIHKFTDESLTAKPYEER